MFFLWKIILAQCVTLGIITTVESSVNGSQSRTDARWACAASYREKQVASVLYIQVICQEERLENCVAVVFLLDI